MKQGYVITLINCQSCKQANSMQSLEFCATVDDVKIRARQIHKASQLVCGNPKLIIVFSNALIANDLLLNANHQQNGEKLQ